MGVKSASAVAISIAVGSLVGCAASSVHHATATSSPTDTPSTSPQTTPEPTTADVTLAYFDHGIGLVGVSNGCCGYQGSRPSRLWLTADGRHWRDVTPPGSGHSGFKSDHPIFEEAAFISRRAGWVTTWAPADTNVEIYRTVDGGMTWSKISGGSHGAHAGAALLVQPLSTTYAYAEQLEPTGPGMNLAVSRDGGRHWSTVYTGPPPRNHARQPLAGPFVMPMVFASTLRGFAADGVPGANPIVATSPGPGYLFMTSDGGHHWIRESPPRPSASRSCPHDGDYRAAVTCLDGLPTFTTPNDGVLPLVVRQRHHAVVGIDVSRDGGISWTLTSTLDVPAAALRQSPLGGYDFTSPLVSAPSITSWWVGAPRRDGIATWWTTDSGRHWHRSSSSLPGTPTALIATPSRSAWLTVDVPIHRDGERTTELLRTTDGGRTWSQVVPR